MKERDPPGNALDGGGRCGHAGAGKGRAPLQNSVTRSFAAAALVALAWASSSAASAESLVAFDSAGATARIQGYLTRPKGAGPFPAVVLIPTCLGLPANRRAISDRIAGWGYVALFVDEFTTRGLKETCAVDFPQGIADAYGALAYLAKLPAVDPARIAALGFSQGADVALEVAASRFAPPDGLAFRVAAAFYPPCANQADAALRLPTLILIGGADQVTPAADCQALAQRQAAARLIVYPGAGHGFDNPEFGGGKRILGMRLDYDRDAARRSQESLRDFLASRLAR
jgi:dienelactone hydrolase